MGFIRYALFFSLVFLLITFSGSSQGVIASDKFFVEQNMTAVTISPNGKYLAMISNDENGQNLNLQKTDNSASQVLLNLSEFTSDKASIGGIAWLDNENVSAQFIEIKKGVENLLDTKSVRFLLVVQIPGKENKLPIIKSVRTKGSLVDPLIDKDDEFLFAKSGIYSQVYRIKPSELLPHKKRLGRLTKKDGGQFKKKNEVASIEGYAVRWFLDSKGVVKAVLSFSSEGELTFGSMSEGGGVDVIHKWFEDKDKEENDDESDNPKKLILPVALANETNTFYCLDFAEDEERSIYKVNYETGEEKLVYESNSHQIVNLILAERTNELVGVKVLTNGQVQNVFINTDPTVLGRNNQTKRKSHLDVRISETQDRRTAVYYSETFNQPGQFHLVDIDTSKKVHIGSLFPFLDRKLNTEQIEGRVLVEGIEIPYILNIPDMQGRKEVPLVVYPHGGPIGVFDSHYFDATSQYMNDNGFAVLRINYRGSSGYTIALKNAGKRQWGNLILKDIIESTKAVLERPEINADKACILGMSYGGYAATMLAINAPEIFKCAVSIAGVSDVNLYLNSPYRSEKQDEWMKENIGDTVGEYALNKKISPLYNVQRLERPILIIHGAQDRVVDVEHAFRLRLMLEKFDKPFEWKIFEEQGHSIDTATVYGEMLNTAVSFISRQLAEDIQVSQK